MHRLTANLEREDYMLYRSKFLMMYTVNWFAVHILVVIWRVKSAESYNTVSDGILNALVLVHNYILVPILTQIVEGNLSGFLRTVKPSSHDVSQILYPILVGLLTFVTMKFFSRSKA